MGARLIDAIDRRLIHLIRRRLRRRGSVLRLLPGALLAPSAKRLRARLVIWTVAIAIVLAGAILWLTLGSYGQ